MNRITLRDVPRYVEGRLPFKCNESLYAERIGAGYVVFSYGEHFPLAVYDPVDGWVFNCDKYSRTTTRHQSKVRMGLPCHMVSDNTWFLKQLVNRLRREV